MPGASARMLTAAPGASVASLGPPPAPVLRHPWSLRPVRPRGDELARVARWMGRPHVADAWGQDWSEAAWAEEVARQVAGDHSRPWTVWLDGEPLAYIEVYRPARDVLARCALIEPHDLGVHLAIGESDRTGRGLGRRLLEAVSDGLFAADPRCARVLGDPDAGHTAARRAFTAAGFALVAEVDLPHKRAALLSRSRPRSFAPTPHRLEASMPDDPAPLRSADEILAAIQRAFDVVQGDDSRTLTRDDRLDADLEFDSLDFIDLVSTLGEELPADAIDAVLDEVSNLRTVGDVVDRLAVHLAATTPG